MKSSNREEIVDHDAKGLFDIVLDIESYPYFIPWCSAMRIHSKNKNEKTQICISTTGIAGPNGGTKLKPVGLVYIGIKVNKSNYIFKKIYKGKRLDIQRKTRDFIFSKINQLI